MKSSKILGIVVFLFIYLVALLMNADAADKKATKAKSKGAPNRITSEPLIPFDINVDKLPTNFSGHDINRIYIALSKADKALIKDEFESTEEYNNRISALRNSILLDSFTYNDTYVYVHKKLETKYDADGKSLTIRIKNSPLFFSQGIDAYTISEKYSEYETGNLFGARITVTRAEIVSCIFFITNSYRFHKALNKDPDFSNDYKIEFKLKLLPENAKSFTKNGAYLFVYKLTPPYLKEFKELRSPEMNFPFDVTTFEKSIQAEILELWLFDSSTGKIIKKIKVDNT